MSLVSRSSGAPESSPFQHGEVGQGVDEGELVAGDEQPFSQQPLDVPQELNLLLGSRDGPCHRCPSPQYAAFFGTIQRTPPLGSATSPVRRGMTWTWACITVCPAAGPSLTPTLKPSGFSSAISLPRTWATSAPHRCLFFFGQIEQAGDVPLGDDERVAFGDGKSVGKCHGELVLQADAGRLQVAEWAVGSGP